MLGEEYSVSTQEQAKAVLDEHGVKLFRAVVAGIYSDGSVNLQREHNQTPEGWPADDSPSVRLDGSHRLLIGDYVWALASGGHSLVLGKISESGEKRIEDKYDISGGDLSGNMTLRKVFPQLTLRRSDNDSSMDILFQNSGGSYEAAIRLLAGSNGDLTIRQGPPTANPIDLPVRVRITSTGLMEVTGGLRVAGVATLNSRLDMNASIDLAGNDIIRGGVIWRRYSGAIKTIGAGLEVVMAHTLGFTPDLVGGRWKEAGMVQWRSLQWIADDAQENGGGGNVYIRRFDDTNMIIRNARGQQVDISLWAER